MNHTLGYDIVGHRERDSVLGDLARDAAADPTWPHEAGPVELLDYLEARRADPAAVDALRAAWRAWTRRKRPISAARTTAESPTRKAAQKLDRPKARPA